MTELRQKLTRAIEVARWILLEEDGEFHNEDYWEGYIDSLQNVLDYHLPANEEQP